MLSRARLFVMDFLFKALSKRGRLGFILWLCMLTAAAENLFCPKKCHCKSTTVQCLHQKLTEIPQGIPSTTEKLFLGFNNLPSITSKSFENLIELKLLDLRSNKIASISKNSFVHQSKMKSLTLINNDLIEIDKDAFSGAISLEKLYLTSNRLHAVPSLAGLTSLQRLVVDTNQILNLTFPPEFNAMKGLSYINVANNRISSLSNTSFVNLQSANLRRLSLSRNFIQFIHPEAFAPLRSLESLKLSFNPLTGEHLRIALSSLSGGNLLSLDISNLSFSNVLPASTFQLLINTNLRTLILDHNHFNSINNNAFQTLPTLLTLKLTSCRIQMISKNAFHGLIHLNNLFLSQNELVDLTWDFPEKLRTLYLDHNKIQKIPNGVFGKLINLKELHLNYNKVHEFQKNAFVGLEKLQKLRLPHNSINAIPSSLFSSLVGLESLELNSNSITTIPNTTFVSMTQLLYLNMADNDITSLPAVLMNGLSQLRYLYLSSNKLGSTMTQNDFSCLFASHNKLQTLNLSDNQIQGTLSKDIFKNLDELKILQLTKNEISSWDGETFKPMSDKIEILDIRENHITTISKSNLEYLNSLKVLKIMKNPFACNCQLRWFRDWLKNTTVLIPNLADMKCNSPKAWQGKHLVDFDRSKIDCTDYTPYYIYGGAAIGLVIALVMTSVMYSYRWYIRFYAYRLGKRMRFGFAAREGYEEIPGNDLLFDLNINYADSDFDWVVHNVMKPFDDGEFGDIKFEGEFKLCVKDRNLRAGPEMPVILENIEKSRFSLIVLSRDFKKDYRCEFELSYCCNHFKYNTSKIIIVTVGDLRAQDIPKILKPFLEKDTYLKWEDKDIAKEHFKQSLYDILQKKE